MTSTENTMIFPCTCQAPIAVDLTTTSCSSSSSSVTSSTCDDDDDDDAKTSADFFEKNIHYGDPYYQILP